MFICTEQEGKGEDTKKAAGGWEREGEWDLKIKEEE